MAELREEIAAYETMRAYLEGAHPRKWVLIHKRALIDIFDAFEPAAESALRRFGHRPCLIRQIGAAPTILPESVRYSPVYGPRV